MSKQYAKEYILEQMEERKEEFEKEQQLLIDFADICTEEETVQASNELGFQAEKTGASSWWIYKEI